MAKIVLTLIDTGDTVGMDVSGDSCCPCGKCERIPTTYAHCA